ncbi:MAG: hypothetical protein CMK07_06030 [Ponticaulis sp.]|nr:hypothetical protein [Ponticaulis sp.]
MCLVALLLVSGCQSVATGEVEHDVSTTYDGNGVLDGAKVRLAIATAYSPEFAALIPSLENAREYRLNGVSYWTGRMRGQDVVLFETGVSLVNAAMNTERLLQNFDVSAIVVSGVAGGVDPELSIGDVTVPRRWAQYNETVYMRQAADGSYTSPVPTELPALDYIVPRGVRIARNEDATAIRRIWFEASPELLELADQAADRARLKRCDAEGLCLPEDPEVIIGGSGVSGSIFLDNARYREYLYETFEAQVAEMETAAIAMVAFSNDIPFVAFRSLSDLAGGGKAEANEIQAFQHLAAENSAELVFAFLDVYGEVTGRADVSPPPPSFCEINFSAASVYGQGALGDDLVEWLKSRFREDSDHRDYLMSRVPQALEIAALVDPDIDAQVLQVWGGYKGRTSPSLAMRFPITAPENRETALRIAAALGYTFTQESVIAQCDDFPGDDKLTASIDLIETGAGDVLSVETLKPVFGMMLGQADGNFNLGFTYYPAEDRFSTLGFTDDGDFERSAIRSVRDDLQVFSGDSAGLTVSETPKWVAYPFNNWREQPLGEAYLEQPGIADLKPGLDAIRSDIITELQAEFSAMQQE